MAEKNNSPDNVAHREMAITRTFDAPRELVFQAWTDPKMISAWWGPRIFTCPRCELDVRPGGKWLIVMRAPDGSEHPAVGTYAEVKKPERLGFVIDHSQLSDAWHDVVDPTRDKKSPTPKYEMHVTVTFEELGTKTKMTLRVLCESSDDLIRFTNMGMNDGWSQSFDKLSEQLTADREIVTTRVVDAARDLVWKAWTDPTHLAKWWGPNGFTNTFHEFDLRPGGLSKYTMHGPDGTDFPNVVRYEEIAKPDRITFEHLEPMHHFYVTTTFEEVDRKTKVTFRMLFDTADECQKIKTFCTEKNEENFDRLETELATMK